MGHAIIGFARYRVKAFWRTRRDGNIRFIGRILGWVTE